ncbi:MAG: hypothetical protein JWO22_4074 [Frankiales bacterium]|nr:hypothetical protein [Frankiales bacterium]
MKKVLIVGSITALLLSPASTALAKQSAGYQPPVVEKVNPVVVADPSGAVSAVVHASYTCSGGSPTHLYIGLKQGPLVNTTDHSTSEFSDTFFSTNWNPDGPGLSLSCDGKKHNQQFLVKPDPYFAPGHPSAPPLHAGQALVQFCLFDSTNTGEDDPNGFAFDYSMKKVVLGD